MTASSETQINTIRLGKLLIQELAADDHPDVLSGWITHYIAELLAKIETETGEAKEKAQATCFDAIIKLWEHRYSEKVGFSGVRDFKAIFETIEKLNPNSPKPIYFNSVKPEEEDSEEVAQLVNFAESLDRITRRLLKKVLNLAAQAASTENTKPLLDSAESISIPNDLRSIQLILQANDEEGKTEPSELETCLGEMEAFADLTKSLARSLKQSSIS